MKILTEAKQIREALEEVEPSQIAVAYVGADWDDYISVDDLEEIIVSPTIGSNPRAIESIMNIKGHENVYFLNELHSKIYIGSNSALVGSCNLTYNALSGNRLLEVAILLENNSSVSQLLGTFNDYKESAEIQYPDFESKIAQLKVLKEKWDDSVQNRLVTDSTRIPELSEYCSNLDKIHIVWYDIVTNLKHDEITISKALPDRQGKTIDEYFNNDDFAFLEEDAIEPGDWILCWLSTNSGKPRANGNISWVHVDHVIPRGYVDPTDGCFTKLAAQSSILEPPNPPFNLRNPATKQIIRDALIQPQFYKLRQPRDHWPLAPADEVTPEFIKYIKERAIAIG